MLTHAAHGSDRGSGTLRFNLFLLPVTALSALVAWTVIGELVGDVYQSDWDGSLATVIVFVGSMLYLSLIFVVLFIPGFAVFLFLMRKINRRFRLSQGRQRTVAVVLSPVIALVFFVIPAIPDDRDDVLSGWWYILGTAVIVALLARLPVVREPPAR